MRSATSSEGPRLVRIAVPCAQTRVHGYRDAFSNEQCEIASLGASPFTRRRKGLVSLHFALLTCSSHPTGTVGR